MACMFITYALEQFVNGQLGDKFGAKKIISIGLLVSGVLNIIFGFTGTITAMMIIWGLKG